MAAAQYTILRGSRRRDGAVGRQSGNGVHHNTENRDAVGIAVVVELIESAQYILCAEVGGV